MVTKRPEIICAHSNRLTLSHTTGGGELSPAKARMAAWRLDIKSAAGRPLPATSAIERTKTSGVNVKTS